MTTLNYSTAHETNFRLIFPFLPFLCVGSEIEKGEQFLLYCKAVNIPSVSLEVTNVDNQWTRTKKPSKELTFTEVTATFAVDELFTNYKFLLDWIYYLKNPESFGHNHQSASVNASLHILSNNKNPKVDIVLNNIFPINISEVPFTVNSTESRDLDATVTFSIDYFTIGE